MKAAGALPSDERVQQMNDQQWLWYYLNLLEDEKEEEEKHRERSDYMGWYVNPEAARRVMEHNLQSEKNKNKNVTKNNTIPTLGEDKIIIDGDEVVNDSFEEELKRALAESGQNSDLVELPSSESAGDATMSQDDFINKVLNMQQTIEMPSVENFDGNDDFNENNINENNLDDIDYFEYPDEGQ
jgi:hypothetical protein